MIFEWWHRHIEGGIGILNEAYNCRGIGILNGGFGISNEAYIIAVALALAYWHTE